MTLLSTFATITHNISESALSGDAVVNYYGILAKDLPFPAATTANLTIDKFVPRVEFTANTAYSANVRGISANLECEPLNLPNKTERTGMPWKSILAPFFTINITTPSCSILNVPMGMGANHNPPHTDITSSYQGWWSNHTCNDGIRNDGRPRYKPIKAGFNDNRLVFVTSLVQWTPDDGWNSNKTESSSDRVTWVEKFIAIICKPTYTIDTYAVTLSFQDVDKSQSFSAIKQANSSKNIEGFTNDDLVPLLKAEAKASRLFKQAQRGPIAEVTNDSGYVRQDDPLFILMSHMYGKSGTSALIDQHALLEAAPKAFSGAMVQIFHNYFTIPIDHDITGNVHTSENRLNLKIMPVAFMITYLDLMSCIAVAMVFLRPHHVVLLDPQSILAKAKALAASPALSSELLEVNGLNGDGIGQRLRGKAYQIMSMKKDNSPSFAIYPSSPGFARAQSKENLASKKRARWQPLNQKIWFALVSILVPLAIIALLEVLQHVSNAENELLDFSPSGNGYTLVILIPAAIMTSTALLFASIHFGTSLMAPFQALSKGGRPLSRGLTVSLEGKSSPHALYLAIKHRLLMPCLSVLAVFVGRLLTIIISGLYFSVDVPLTKEIRLQRTDKFNYTRNDLSKSDNLASVTTRLIYYQNLSYPQWTYNNLVFPQLTYADPIDPAHNESTILLEIPAIRPALQCVKIPPKDFSYDKLISFKSYPGPGLPEGTLSYYKTVVDLPCLVNGTVMGCDFDLSFPTYLPIETPEGSVTGTANTENSLLCNAVPRGLERLTNDSNTYPLADGCPSFAYFLGTTSTSQANGTSFKQGKPEIYGFLCYQHLEEVQTKVTFKMADLSISTSTPPSPKEETAKTLNVTYSNYIGPAYINSLKTLLDTFPSNGSLLYGFMRGVIEGKGGLDVNSLLGEVGISKLMTSTENLYATYMVQAIDANFRVPLDDDDQKDDNDKDNKLQTSYPATLTNPHRQRLKQDQTRSPDHARIHDLRRHRRLRPHRSRNSPAHLPLLNRRHDGSACGVGARDEGSCGGKQR
jgi:Protein of unknown function (DUF3433)